MKNMDGSCLLYAVTDRRWLDGRALEEDVEAAILGGVTMVQLREKELPDDAFEEEARRVQQVCRRYGVPLIINDNVALAVKIGADGVHVGQSDMKAGDVRALIGPGRILGVTAKTVEAARAAEAAGADYLGSGAVFGTDTKPDAVPMEHALFEEICRSVAIPVVAIGHINAGNLARLSGRGMKGFAIVSGIFAEKDITSACRELRVLAEAAAGSPDYTALIRATLGTMHRTRPVIQCITNVITANDCANALLAIGASPTMAHHPEEMEDFARISDALVLNMGATESIAAMRIAAENAAELSHPVVIDPVGCAGSAFRRRMVRELIRLSHPACIRGNAAEIRALALDTDTGRGVDDLSGGGCSAGEETSVGERTMAAEGSGGASERREQRSLMDVIRDARALSAASGAIVIASGGTDVVVYQDAVRLISRGTEEMARITGSGCMLSSLLGAFLTAGQTIDHAAACCAFIGMCGEEAAARTKEEEGGTGTFRVRFIDALSRLRTGERPVSV